MRTLVAAGAGALLASSLLLANDWVGVQPQCMDEAIHYASSAQGAVHHAPPPYAVAQPPHTGASGDGTIPALVDGLIGDINEQMLADPTLLRKLVTPLRILRTRTLPDTFLLACYDHDKVCQDVSDTGIRSEWFAGLGQRIKELDPASSTFLDIGANTGFFALAAAARGVRTVAVEPALDDIVRLNIALNAAQSHLTLYNYALVEDPSVSSVNITIAVSNRGSSTLVDTAKTTEWAGAIFDPSEVVSKAVPATTLDALVDHAFPGSAPVSLVKIDTEGFEAFIMRGASKALASGRLPVICSELHSRFLVSAGASPASYFATMRAAGYGIRQGLAPDAAFIPEGEDATFLDSVKDLVTDVCFEKKTAAR